MSENENVQLRISILNVPDDLSPLKLRGYLKAEADDIQAKTPDNGHVQIRLFLPERTRLIVTQKKLDKMLKDIVDKYPNIYSIQLVGVEHPLSHEEMLEAAEEAKSDLNILSKRTDSDDEQKGPTH